MPPVPMQVVLTTGPKLREVTLMGLQRTEGLGRPQGPAPEQGQ